MLGLVRAENWKPVGDWQVVPAATCFGVRLPFFATFETASSFLMTEY
jgi:hypothetical protein